MCARTTTCIKSKALPSDHASSICTSSYHELQRYGKRAEGLQDSKTVKKATYVQQINEDQYEDGG